MVFRYILLSFGGLLLGCIVNAKPILNKEEIEQFKEKFSTLNTCYESFGLGIDAAFRFEHEIVLATLLSFNYTPEESTSIFYPFTKQFYLPEKFSLDASAQVKKLIVVGMQPTQNHWELRRQDAAILKLDYSPFVKLFNQELFLNNISELVLTHSDIFAITKRNLLIDPYSLSPIFVLRWHNLKTITFKDLQIHPVALALLAYQSQWLSLGEISSVLGEKLYYDFNQWKELYSLEMTSNVKLQKIVFENVKLDPVSKALVMHLNLYEKKVETNARAD